MKQLAALLLTAILCVSCGYSNPYTTSSESADATDDRILIHLEMWENDTNLLGYEARIQRSLVQWLKKMKKFSLVQDEQKADYTFSGKIISADFPGLSYGTYERAIELRAKIKFTYTLTDKKTNVIRLQRKEFPKIESFMIGSSAAETDGNKRIALYEIADELAEEIYVQLSYLLVDKKKGT